MTFPEMRFRVSSRASGDFPSVDEVDRADMVFFGLRELLGVELVVPDDLRIVEDDRPVHLGIDDGLPLHVVLELFEPLVVIHAPAAGGPLFRSSSDSMLFSFLMFSTAILTCSETLMFFSLACCMRRRSVIIMFSRSFFSSWNCFSYSSPWKADRSCWTVASYCSLYWVRVMTSSLTTATISSTTCPAARSQEGGEPDEGENGDLFSHGRFL